MVQLGARRVSSRHGALVELWGHQLILLAILRHLSTPPVLRAAAQIVEAETVVIEAEQVLVREELA
jgi:hypothetical protein